MATIEIRFLSDCVCSGRVYRPFHDEIDDRTYITFPVLFALSGNETSTNPENLVWFSGEVRYASNENCWIHVGYPIDERKAEHEKVSSRFKDYLLRRDNKRVAFFSFKSEERKRGPEIGDQFEIRLEDGSHSAIRFDGESWNPVISDDAGNEETFVKQNGTVCRRR